MEWQCTGDAVRQSIATDGDGSGGKHRHGEHGLGHGGQSGAWGRHVEHGVFHSNNQAQIRRVRLGLASASYPAGKAVAGDFNGDGKLDLAVTNQGDNTVSILLGDGTGNFTLASSLAVGNLPYSVAAG